jgi:DNA topoisomerase IA
MSKKKLDITQTDFTPLMERMMESVKDGDLPNSKKLWDEITIEWRNEVRRVIKEVNESKGR